jgi:pimeloyl-ACP methyl ester carboxylesterase
LHYITGGQGDPLVLLHGYPQTHHAWQKVIPELAKHFTTKLQMPVLAIGADSVYGSSVEQRMQQAAVNVQGVVIANCGHFVPEEQPEVLLQHLLSFAIK